MFESGGNTVIDERRDPRVAKRGDDTLSLLAVRRLVAVEHASRSQKKTKPEWRNNPTTMGPNSYSKRNSGPRRIEVPVNRTTEILNGRRSVAGDTVLRLGRLFGTSREFWLNLPKLYEPQRAEQKNGSRIARLPTLDAGTDLHTTA